MTRTLTLSAIVLIGLSAAAQAQSTKSGGCGPETWSTDKMAYVGVPCSDGVVPQRPGCQRRLAAAAGLRPEHRDGDPRHVPVLREGDREGVVDLGGLASDRWRHGLNPGLVGVYALPAGLSGECQARGV